MRRRWRRESRTGLHCAPDDAGALRRAMALAVALHGDRTTWVGMQRNGMKADFSWGRSAARYAALFADLVKGAG